MNNGSMKAVGVIPRKREVALLDHATPQIIAPTDVKVRTIEVGICGTDREICYLRLRNAAGGLGLSRPRTRSDGRSGRGRARSDEVQAGGSGRADSPPGVSA